MFSPLSKARTLEQWLMPLPGCPKCDYAYEREPGYFLPATWMVHCFSVLGLGTALFLLADWLWDLNSLTLVVIACVPALLFSFLFARHSKAIYLALDHWIDPPIVSNTANRSAKPMGDQDASPASNPSPDV